MANARIQRSYSIAEWYGRPFTSLTDEERTKYAELQSQPKESRVPQRCPFQSGKDDVVYCKKAGGVCSIRQYERNQDGRVTVASDLTATCPRRFEEDDTVVNWIGETLLGTDQPIDLGQMGFLRRANRDVGRIDNVLVVRDSVPLNWCAVEMQAVYFSGAKMADEFDGVARLAAGEDAFPIARRRPDFRSSGPKRLMPQLQIKVPTLSRWGKKMAVVVDESFYQAMGDIETVPHLSNCDIAWFVVKYDESSAGVRLVRGEVHLATLAASVIGLTAGEAVDQQTFEQRILDKMKRLV